MGNSQGGYILRKFLEGLDRKELLGFLDDYAKNDPKFANAVNVRFCDPEFDEELDKIKRAIGNALEGVSDYSVRDSWGNVSFETGDIYDEIGKRIEQGHIKLAFAETEMLYRELLNLFEYQGECEISMEAEYCIGFMSDIADAAVSEDDKAHIFRHCIMLSDIEDGKDYGADYEDKLLEIASKLVTLETRQELEDALACVEVRRFEESIKLIQLDIMRKFDGSSAVYEFINENLRYPKIREIAFASALSLNDFTEAEKLCVEAIAAETRNYGISPWLYKLYTVYEKAEKVNAMVETARKIVFLGDMKYYDILKSLLTEQGIWDNEYMGFIRDCETKMHSTGYMRVLAKEREFSLLLDQLKKDSSQVYEYGELLVKEYPTDIWIIFLKQINKEADAATKRSMYRDVCSHIMTFAKIGYHTDVINLALDLVTAYKHKPAFVDELNQLIVKTGQ